MEKTQTKSQIKVTCTCGNEYCFVGQDFELDICKPLYLTCKKCGNKIDLFELGKQAVNN